jgi:membrane protein
MAIRGPNRAPGSIRLMSSPSWEPKKLADEASRDFDIAKDEATKALAIHPHASRLVGIVGGVLREQAAERVGLAASGATFWLIIATLPTAIAIISLFGLVVSPEQVATDLGKLATGAPASLGSLLTSQLRRVAASDHTGLSLGLAVSIFLAVWSASAGVYNLDRAIRQAYGLPPQRYVEARGRAVTGAVAVVVAIGLSALAISTLVGRSPDIAVLIVGVPTILVVITWAVMGLYRFSVARRVPIRALLPGALASSIGVVAVVAGFDAYVSWASRYTAVYGVFAGAVIGMLGTYLAVYVVLLGAVLNVQVASVATGHVPASGAEAD